MKKHKKAIRKNPATDAADIVHLILLSLYFLIVELVSFKNTVIDQMGGHWLLLSILNVLCLAYIFRNKKLFEHLPFSTFFKNPVTIVFGLFFLISGLSIFVAINKVESMVAFSRLTTTFIALFVFYILLFRRLNILKNLAFVVALIGLFQAYDIVTQFYEGMGKSDSLSKVINNLKGNASNKNILAVALMMKVPLIAYAVLTRKRFTKIISIVSLWIVLLAIFFINTRTAYFGLLAGLLILIIGVGIIYFKDQQRKSHYSNLGLVLLVVITSLTVSEITMNKAKSQKEKMGKYGAVTERITEIKPGIRLTYWKESIELIKQRPITGVGYGNFKLYAPTYTNTLLNETKFSKHPHNDFFEISVESGIINGFVFLGIFIIGLILSLRILFSKKTPETKLIAVVALACLAGYFFDAMLNFPLERPVMQILFVFILALIATNFFAEKSFEIPEKNKLFKPSLISVLLIAGGVFYISYIVFQSFKAQVVVYRELRNPDKGLSPYDEVKKTFPSFPNISEDMQTIGYKLARYLDREERYDEAIKVLDSVYHFHPYSAHNHYLKSSIYGKQEQMDSSYHYAKKAFYTRPRHINHYRTAVIQAGKQKDTAEVFEMFRLYNEYETSKDKLMKAYAEYVRALIISGYESKKILEIIDEGVALYPDLNDELRVNVKR